MKKLVLLALLAGSMLASCAAEAKVAVKPAADPLAGFFEDTDAHEEIFGKQTLPFVNLPKSAPIDAVGGSAAIKLGVQKATLAGGEHAGKAVRFIAAVNFTNVSTDTAVWTRTIWHDLNSGDDSGKVFKAEAEKESTKAYLSLNNGGVEYTISDFNASPAAGGNTYTHFVVYTIGGISGDSFDKYVINAYLTINDDDEHASDVLSTTVDLSTSFTFPKAKLETSYFGVKKTKSGFACFDREETAGSGNFARFEEISMAEGDSFVLVNSAADYFGVYGYDKVSLGDGTRHFERDGSSNFASSKFATKYDLFLSSGYDTTHYIYADLGTLVIESGKVYFEAGAWPDGWGGSWRGGALTYAYFFKDAVAVGAAFPGTEMATWSDKLNVYVIDIPATATGVIFSRVNPENKGQAWNQTVDITLSSNNYFALDGGKDGSNHLTVTASAKAVTA